MPPDSLSGLLKTIEIAKTRAHGETAIVAVAGPQGAGKSTLTEHFCKETRDAACFSLDDFYLPASQRQRLAQEVHPLLQTRGVPGTHDVAALRQIIERLRKAAPHEKTQLPVFDKLADEPSPQSRAYQGRPDVILIDGWCLGARPVAADQLLKPVNDLEALEDSTGVWRRFVNNQLTEQYAALFASMHAILYLQAPDFDIVHRWRREQEEQMRGRPLEPLEAERLTRFVSHYERITRAMLRGTRRSEVSVLLDPNRAAAAVIAEV